MYYHSMKKLFKPTIAFLHDFLKFLTVVTLGIGLSFLVACGTSSSPSSSTNAPSSGSPGSASSDVTTGNPFVRPALALSEFDAATSALASGAHIDTSHVAEGYVSASGTSATRLKLEVTSGNVTMYYDLPSDGTPISAPLSMGNGAYDFAIWENTSDSRYAELARTSTNVAMIDEFQPFIRPNVFCDYDQFSNVTALANELSAGAQNEGDVVKAVYDWVVNNITYDDALASKLSGQSGYVPDPDKTIATKKGICFDYSSTVAALLRSQGIPCKIVTGNVAPNDVYHAWNMIYIDGTWINAVIDVRSNTWTRLDTTFAAGGDSKWVGNGSSYTDRYIY